MVFNPSSSPAQKDGRAMSTKSKVYGLQLSTSGKDYDFHYSTVHDRDSVPRPDLCRRCEFKNSGPHGATIVDLWNPRWFLLEVLNLGDLSTTCSARISGTLIFKAGIAGISFGTKERNEVTKPGEEQPFTPRAVRDGLKGVRFKWFDTHACVP